MADLAASRTALCNSPPPPMRFGTVALVGRSNVGKSTILNALIGERLAIVSQRPQTTRDTLLGVLERGDAQIALLDTPGLHRPKSELGRRMNAAALEAARGADVVVFMTDIGAAVSSRRKQRVEVDSEDRPLVLGLPKTSAAVLVINKVDLLRDKAMLLPLIEAFMELRSFQSVVPTSALDGSGLEDLLDEITTLLPHEQAGYPVDTLTDRPTSFFVREYVREQVLEHTVREVPHAVAVSVDALSDGRHALVADCTIHVEKPGQRKILVGHGGDMIKRIGTLARARLERLLERKVVLKLFVRVTPRWRDNPRLLGELGYDAALRERPPTRPSDAERDQPRGRRSPSGNREPPR